MQWKGIQGSRASALCPIRVFFQSICGRLEGVSVYCVYSTALRNLAIKMSDTKTPRPTFNFTAHPSTSSFAVPYETYLSTHPGEKFKYEYIATGALVFDASTPRRILLIQRAAHDSMPSRWEIPGGACDKEDPTILHSAARELWEEAGLTATNIGPQVGDGHFFLSRSGKLVCKFNFLVDAEKGAGGKLDVELDPSEHQNYAWVAEEEVKARKVGDVELKFTTREQEAVVLEAFTARREMNADVGE
jgi:8-oxo-dGTP pyrophosphatase MutT (NUDIX family)